MQGSSYLSYNYFLISDSLFRRVYCFNCIEYVEFLNDCSSFGNQIFSFVSDACFDRKSLDIDRFFHNDI